MQRGWWLICACACVLALGCKNGGGREGSGGLGGDAGVDGGRGGTGGDGGRVGGGGFGGVGGFAGTGGFGAECASGMTRDCYEGPPGTVGVGVCVSGVETCSDEGTEWGPCLGQVIPSSEVPTPTGGTPADEDCDGLTDEV